MKVNLKNVCYPKPILSSYTDDFNDNVFEIQIIGQEYDKVQQKLKLKISTSISNPIISRLIDENKVAIILHLEQKTKREPSVLNRTTVTEKEINLLEYATTEPIELIAMLYCREDFVLDEGSALNNIYTILDTKIEYQRGDILGYSNELEIKLPEDRRIGSIFNVIKDTDNTLKGQPLKVILDGSSNLIQILLDKDIHEKYIKIYKKDQFVKRLMFFSIVECAVVSAYSEMFNSYETYKDTKWCMTLSMKVEQILKVPASDLFMPGNYDLNKVYEYTNYALGDLFKDAVNVYESGMEDN